MFSRKAAEGPKGGMGRLLVKASPVFGRRRLLKKTRTILFLPTSFLTFGKSIVVVRGEDEEGVSAKIDLSSGEVQGFKSKVSQTQGRRRTKKTHFSIWSSNTGKSGWTSLFDTGYAWLDWAPGSISVHVLSRISTVLVDEQTEKCLLGFALAFDRLVRASKFVFIANSPDIFSARCRRPLLFIDQIRDQLIQSMRSSDPRGRIVFVHRFNSDFHSVFTFQIAGCDFKHGPILVFPQIQPFGSVDFFISWQRCVHDMSLVL